MHVTWDQAEQTIKLCMISELEFKTRLFKELATAGKELAESRVSSMIHLSLHHILKKRGKHAQPQPSTTVNDPMRI